VCIKYASRNGQTIKDCFNILENEKEFVLRRKSIHPYLEVNERHRKNFIMKTYATLVHYISKNKYENHLAFSEVVSAVM
jgi:hypothetical protein